MKCLSYFPNYETYVTDPISFASAEINHFQQFRVGDFASYTKKFLEQQIVFHQEVGW